jgi:hypothetical protein
MARDWPWRNWLHGKVETLKNGRYGFDGKRVGRALGTGMAVAARKRANGDTDPTGSGFFQRARKPENKNPGT